MNYKFIFTVLITLFLCQIATAQKLDERKLNLYKPGRTKVLTYQVGNDLTFRMKNSDDFYTFKITNLQGNSIFFGDNIIQLKDIEAIKYPRRGGGIASKLYLFSGAWLMFTGVDDLMGNNPSWVRAGIISATAASLGLILQLVTRPKTYVLNENKYLRILIP
jgi:hypothetical protein